MSVTSRGVLPPLTVRDWMSPPMWNPATSRSSPRPEVLAMLRPQVVDDDGDGELGGPVMGAVYLGVADGAGLERGAVGAEQVNFHDGAADSEGGGVVGEHFEDAVHHLHFGLVFVGLDPWHVDAGGPDDFPGGRVQPRQCRYRRDRAKPQRERHAVTGRGLRFVAEDTAEQPRIRRLRLEREFQVQDGLLVESATQC